LSIGKCRDFIVSVKVAWCVWVKLNVLQKRWLVCRLTALLILRSVGILSSLYSTVVDGLHGRHSLAGNGLQLQEVGDFEAQNCLPALNLIRSTNLHLTTEPPIFCRCCYGLVFFNIFNQICPKIQIVKCLNFLIH